MADNGTSWASVIPEFFYELIGRIIPGGTFILGLIYTINQSFLCEVLFKTKDGSSIEPSSFLIFNIFLGLSYSSGFLLTPLGDKLCKIYYKGQYKEKFREYKKHGEHSQWLWNEVFNNKKTFPQNGELLDDDVDLLFQNHHNLVKKKYEKQSPSLSKSAADVQLCINTSAAFFIIAIISPLVNLLLFLLVDNPINVLIYLTWVAALIIARGFFWAAYYRNNRFLSRQFSFSLEVQKEREEKKEDDEKKKQDEEKKQNGE